MRLSQLAFGTFVLVTGSTFLSAAFAPRTTRASTLSLSTTAATTPAGPSSTALYTAISPPTAAQVGLDLGLEYVPISPFGKGQASVANDKRILGGKGANLAEMSELGLSVPPGFTITTECCDRYCNEWQAELPNALWEQVVASLGAVEEEMTSAFGSPENPLLLSVRSGAAISMPGMVRILFVMCSFLIGWANPPNDVVYLLSVTDLADRSVRSSCCNRWIPSSILG